MLGGICWHKRAPCPAPTRAALMGRRPWSPALLGEHPLVSWMPTDAWPDPTLRMADPDTQHRPAGGPHPQALAQVPSRECSSTPAPWPRAHLRPAQAWALQKQSHSPVAPSPQVDGEQGTHHIGCMWEVGLGRSVVAHVWGGLRWRWREGQRCGSGSGRWWGPLENLN